MVLTNMCNVIPAGVVCFFTSSSWLNLALGEWKKSTKAGRSVLERIEVKKVNVLWCGVVCCAVVLLCCVALCCAVVFCCVVLCAVVVLCVLCVLCGVVWVCCVVVVCCVVLCGVLLWYCVGCGCVVL